MTFGQSRVNRQTPDGISKLAHQKRLKRTEELSKGGWVASIRLSEVREHTALATTGYDFSEPKQEGIPREEDGKGRKRSRDLRYSVW